MLTLKAELVVSSLNEFSKINLNEIRRTSMHDDGVFNDCQLSDQEFDEEIDSTQRGGLVEMTQPKEVEPEPEEEQDAA